MGEILYFNCNAMRHNCDFTSEHPPDKGDSVTYAVFPSYTIKKVQGRYMQFWYQVSDEIV